MITDYHRPQTLKEALTLLAQPNTVPLGGGTLLSKPTIATVSVVDLQALDLNTITSKGNELEIGATVTLQQLLESNLAPAALKTALKLEAPLNLRNSATVAGTLVASDGRSTFVTALLAMDAKITVTGKQLSVTNVGEFLPLRPKGLITAITIPTNAKFAFEYVSRTPADKPLVCVALAQWNSGRARMAIGGFGKSPSLAMDGTEAEGLEAAAHNACHESTDEWASAEYRQDVAATLAKRCLEDLQSV
ncbi:MAG TPA: FAD binding domain-containing protein [Anaerolineales bacterium]|nr:FAD binding domain-containing protein [Anaerolineales bacterium]